MTTLDERTVPDADIIDVLAEIAPGSPLEEWRGHRAQAKENAQRSFVALLEPAAPGDFTHGQRYAVATFVAGLLSDESASTFYGDLLSDEYEDDSVIEALSGAVAAAQRTGPYGAYAPAPLAGESVAGQEYRVPGTAARVLGTRLVTALEYTHMLVLHPRDAAPGRLQPLFDAGWDEDGIVSLGQLVSFLNFQIRLAGALRVLGENPGGDDRAGGGAGDAGGAGASAAGVSGGGTVGAGGDSDPADDPREEIPAGPVRVLEYPDLDRPQVFRQGGLDWVPWIAPPTEEELTERQVESLVKPERTKSAYFRLLARDPDALEARTLTDLDIFFNFSDGLPSAERELAATVASRLNGCLYCASIHSRRADQESEGRTEDIERLLAEGVGADLGSERWNAVAAAAVAVTATPETFGPDHVERLRAAGLSDGEIIDVINGAAFFNWANRLMLSLGEPTPFRLG
ncbi:alkylhydroperoxidase domain protein [Brevibacterium litoralis]|uniref:alkylhydroperoxidase domain protein n=1 Tax=Brevibacterium litoralis TaxID=3138935 RepID=UPI0032EE5ABF